jgi:hypothetical protein
MFFGLSVRLRVQARSHIKSLFNLLSRNTH